MSGMSANSDYSVVYVHADFVVQFRRKIEAKFNSLVLGRTLLSQSSAEVSGAKQGEHKLAVW
jgi:hypothetical protein